MSYPLHRVVFRLVHSCRMHIERGYISMETSKRVEHTVEHSDEIYPQLRHDFVWKIVDAPCSISSS